jgi:alkanesulfonate monooxygenase SsuD/methylene tetrahydromethanopterin reductase-like flavin-dependent oxidoreductase (luciferase family)
MKFGFVVPWGDAEDVGDLAAAAEEAGWDGLFVWEPVWGVDAWISLGLAAVRTSKIRLGTLLTPPSRRRPWELASQVATVDRISAGRVTLSVGLGAIDSGFDTFGEECDRRIRAELMDETLDIMCGLWAGQPFAHDGTHYTVAPTEFPTIGHTVQKPRVPIWCVGAIGRSKSIELRSQLDIDRPADDIDIVVEGTMSEHSPAAYADAGATWWIESMWDAMAEHSPVAAAYDRLSDGPPV